MTDHAKQLAEEYALWCCRGKDGKRSYPDKLAWWHAKCLSVMDENERLRGNINEMAKELHAAINEPMYAGTRLDWMNRAYAAERELEQARKEKQP